VECECPHCRFATAEYQRGWGDAEGEYGRYWGSRLSATRTAALEDAAAAVKAMEELWSGEGKYTVATCREAQRRIRCLITEEREEEADAPATTPIPNDLLRELVEAMGRSDLDDDPSLHEVGAKIARYAREHGLKEADDE
jgi:hypothetical protein